MRSFFPLVSVLLLPILGCSRSPLSPPGAGFSVAMPGEAKNEIHTINTDIGPVTLNMYVLETGDWAYIAGYSDYPSFPNGVAAALDGARDGALKSSQSTLLSEEIISLAGHSGRELRMEGPRGLTTRLRLVVVGTRLYQVGVVTKKDDAFSPKVRAFLDTFRLTTPKNAA